MPAINTKYPKGLDTTQAKELLVAALEANLDPDFSLTDGTEAPGNVWLSTSQAIRLDAYVARHPGRSRAAVTFGLIRRAHQGHNAPQPQSSSNSNPENVLHALIHAGAVRERADQILLLKQMLESLRQGKVLMAEAGTGTGKSLAICCAAFELIKMEGTRVAISAPTYAVLRQLHKEWDLIDRTLGTIPDAISLFGKQEFVDVARTMDLLVDPECPWSDAAKEPIRKWIEAHGAAPIDDPWAPPFLASSLAQQPGCEDIAPPSLGTGTDDDDPGLIAYRNQFITARDIPVIFLTHAMLAIDLKHRYFRSRSDESVREEIKSIRDRHVGGISLPDGAERADRKAYAQAMKASEQETVALLLAAEDDDGRRIPAFDYLLLDEAHSFEETASRIMSLDLSLASVRAQARRAADEGSLPQARYDLIKKGVNALIELGNKLNDLSVNVMEDPELRQLASKALQMVSQGLAKAGPEFTAHRNSLSAILRQIETANASLICMVEFTPVKHWPHVYAGRKSISTELSMLWAGVKGGACVSATLYTPKSSGELSAWLMQRKLAIPEGKIKTMMPLAPKWLFSPVTMYLPKGDETEALLPVSMSRRRNFASLEELDRAEKKWIDALHARIVPIVDTAVGGTLILCVSYDAVNRLSQKLQNLGDRLIVASREEAFPRQVNRFMELSKQDMRPVWLATGPAWTGLDLSQPDRPPHEDQTITDLVVTRLPFGLSRSLGQRVKLALQKPEGYLDEALDCARRLRQGLGRGVRRDGLTNNRRFFILDGRLSDPSSLLMTAPSLRVVDAYRPRILPLSGIKDMRNL